MVLAFGQLGFISNGNTGMAPGDFDIIAASQKLARMGRSFPGVSCKRGFDPIRSRPGAA